MRLNLSLPVNGGWHWDAMQRKHTKVKVLLDSKNNRNRLEGIHFVLMCEHHTTKVVERLGK